MTAAPRRSTMLLLGSLLLAGCAAETRSTCPAIQDYPKELRDRAADELELLPLGSAIEQMLADYEDLREELRACGRRR